MFIQKLRRPDPPLPAPRATTLPPELFASATHVQAINAILDAVRAGTACAVLTGHAGLGKTIILQAAAAALAAPQQSWIVVTAAHPAPSPLDLHRRIAAAMGLGDTDPTGLDDIAHRLAAGTQRPVVLLIDNAHLLPPATLAYLALASELFRRQRPLLQVVLVGRPELLELLSHPDSAGRFTAGARHVELLPLDAAEMRRYIAFRLAPLGYGLDHRAASDVLEAVVAEAEGVPRRADQLLMRVPLPAADRPRRRWIALPVGRLAAIAAGLAAVALVGSLAWRTPSPQPAPSPGSLPPPHATASLPAPAPSPRVATNAPIPAAAPPVAEAPPPQATASAPPPAPSPRVATKAPIPAAAPPVAEPAPPHATASTPPPAPRPPAATNAPIPAAAPPVAEAPPPPLPANAPIRLSLFYTGRDAQARDRAAAAAAALRDDGMQVLALTGADRQEATLLVRYFFVEDRDAAADVARRLSRLTSRPATIELARRDPIPVPGAIDALLP